ncbi:MAG: MBL fold metallo-hydrolase [Nakamurella sp.]
MLIAGFPTGSLAANCYVLAPADGADCVIVDPGEDALAAVQATVAEHRLRPVAALLTHGHLDHAAALRDVASAYGIPGYLHPADEYMLDDPLSALSPEFRQMLVGYDLPAMRPDELRRLAAADVLTFGELELTVIHTPGHTGGSVLFVLAADGERPEVLFTGDTLFAGSVGRTDLPGGSTATLTASLRSGVLGRPDTAVILPGHGPRGTIGAEKRTNPFLVPLLDGPEPTDLPGGVPPTDA